MADEEDEVEETGAEGSGEEGAEGKGKGGKLKLIMFIVVPILLLVGGGAAAYFTGALDSMLGKDAEQTAEEGVESVEAGGEHQATAEKAEGHGGGGKGEEGVAGESAFLAIPPMIVNLNTEDGTPRFLRLTVQLELSNPADKAQVEAVLPRVVDQFQTYLRELRVKDLRGSAGIYRLQIELLWRVNQAVEPIEIKDVLFQEILIQ